jgi:hypothetical protein
MITKNETKALSLKEWCLFIAIFAAFCVVGTMDYDDAVAQHEINCASATYVNDNNLDCGE